MRSVQHLVPGTQSLFNTSDHHAVLQLKKTEAAEPNMYQPLVLSRAYLEFFKRSLHFENLSFFSLKIEEKSLW